MNSRPVVDIETRFGAVFGMPMDRQFWRAAVPLVRMSFGDEEDPVARVNAALHVSEEILNAVLAGSEVSVHLTLWKNDHSAAVGQLDSLGELSVLGIRDVLGFAESELATVVYATIEQFTSRAIRELLLRIYRFEMALEPSLAATLILARLTTQPTAVLIDDDRGLDVITTDPSIVRSISARFDKYVYQATSP